jgi:hypothetical protein
MRSLWVAVLQDDGAAAEACSSCSSHWQLLCQRAQVTNCLRVTSTDGCGVCGIIRVEVVFRVEWLTMQLQHVVHYYTIQASYIQPAAQSVLISFGTALKPNLFSYCVGVCVEFVCQESSEDVR